MPYSPSNIPRSRIIRIIVVAGSGLLLLLVAGFTVEDRESPKPVACSVTDASFPEMSIDDATDIHAVSEYQEFAGSLLRGERFHDLDCIADSTRANKEKFSGGMWKLHSFYVGLILPRQHPTEEDWNTHFQRLEKWVSENPNSVTARIALAHAYVEYGWVARGNDYAENVSDSGWKLFRERVGKAREILEKAAALPVKCPEWYVAMQRVAQSEGWELQKAEDLLQKSVAFEPEYYYAYRMHADFLAPKWYGKDGDAERFVTETADKIGGEEGDIVYFQVASYMICRCGEEKSLELLSWPRIQKGFAADEKRYGASMTNLNLLAYMAVQNKDAIAAKAAFARIGDQWNKDTWGNQGYFQQCRAWAETA